MEEGEYMNPNQSKMAQQPMQPFTQQHNQVYEQLRQALMKLHQQGVPGMDQVLNSLNQQHVKLAGGRGGQAQQPQPAPTPQAPQQNGGPMPSNLVSSQ